jgi:uncharacterized protein YidB (DUF937 family)
MSGLDDLLGSLTQGSGGSGGGGGMGDLLGSLLGGGGGGEKAGGGGMNTGALIAALAPVAIGMLKGGGLQKILGGFQSNGMEKQADSWVSTGPNEQVTGADMRVGLGEAQVQQVAKEAGISEDEAADVLAKVVPEVVNELTPNGQVPSDAELEAVLQKAQPASA